MRWLLLLLGVCTAACGPRPVLTFRAHPLGVSRMLFLPGTPARLVTAGRTGTPGRLAGRPVGPLIVWEIPSWQPLAALATPPGWRDVVVSPGGDLLAVGASLGWVDGRRLVVRGDRVTLWSTSTLEALPERGPPRTPSAVASEPPWWVAAARHHDGDARWLALDYPADRVQTGPAGRLALIGRSAIQLAHPEGRRRYCIEEFLPFDGAPVAELRRRLDAARRGDAPDAAELAGARAEVSALRAAFAKARRVADEPQSARVADRELASRLAIAQRRLDRVSGDAGRLEALLDQRRSGRGRSLALPGGGIRSASRIGGLSEVRWDPRPTGTLYAWGIHRDQVAVFDSGGREHDSLPGHAPRGLDWIELTPDGAWMATGGRPALVLRRRASADGRQWETVQRLDGGCTTLVVSPDGRWLVVADVPYDKGPPRLRVLRRLEDDAGPWRVALDAAVPATRAAFDPEGRWLATATGDGVVHVWSLADLE